jgi:DNA-damage-inducible protein J
MKTGQSTIQIRIDTKTKNASRKILEEIGLDMSTAVKLFLKNVVNSKSFPLELRTENGFTVAEEQEMIRETEEAFMNGKRYSSAEELLADLNT